MTESNQEVVRAAIFEIIENQMREGTPPQTKTTYNRLISAGHSKLEAMKLIGCAVTVEIFDVMKENKPYNEERYVAALEALPELPFEDDED
jgi:peroxiredoxin family protein